MKFAFSTDTGRTYSVQVPWWLLPALLVAGLLWQPATAWAADRFSDVPSSNVFQGDINWMADNGVTSGCGGTKFCPKDPVTREQMSAFMRRLDSKNVFTTFAEVQSMVATGTAGPIDADTLDGKDSTAFALAGDLAALQAKVTELEALLAGVTRTGDVLTFTGMNVQVVSGSGSTDGTINGLGNLIVGYNEDDSNVRTGSHNLVVGPYHDYSSYGGFVAGLQNTVSGPHTTVSGGIFSTASGPFAAVTGGFNNRANAESSSVAGGEANVANALHSTVSGGFGNTASGVNAAVTGGADNIASGVGASVTGGLDNFADEEYATVTGGRLNGATEPFASVSGGLFNSATGPYASVSGGEDNTASGVSSAVSGGRAHNATGIGSSVTGGSENFASGIDATVSGGFNREAVGDDDWVAGELFQDN